MTHHSARTLAFNSFRALAVIFLGITFGIASVSANAATNATTSATTTAGFHHPGVLVNREQLEFVKAKVAAGLEPWKSAFEAAKASDLGALTYTPHPIQTCECGPFSKPDIGCKDEQH